MHRSRRFLTAAACSITLLLSACSTANPDTSGRTTAAEGAPIAGGVVRAIQMGEPRSLDPATLSNTWAYQPLLGNALYGTLIINNLETFEIEYKMATDFSTADGGATFTMTLQPGLMFTDGTSLDAAAVKFNWDRLRDPALGSSSIRQASQVATSEVIDATTLKIALVAPNPQFPQGLLSTAMNWIASPTALQKDRATYDNEPVGAGPFTLTKWTRQDTIELEKNPGYWDAPKPYLDRMTLRTDSDTSQRINAITTGAADLASETSWSSFAQAEAAGFPAEVVATGGGQYLAMNFRRFPFDDERARRAVSLAVDLDAMNAVVSNGEAQVPKTLFPESSPFFTDVALPTPDKKAAQKLFDELAAEGESVKFTFLSYPTTESRVVAESLQAQLSAVENVDVEVQVVDYATATARTGAHDFDMLISAAIIQDPDYALWTGFHADSRGNFTGIDDAELSAALDAGRTGTTVAARKDAYEIVQKRLIALSPGLWYTRAAPSVMTGKDVHGIELYTLGSPLPEELWITK